MEFTKTKNRTTKFEPCRSTLNCAILKLLKINDCLLSLNSTANKCEFLFYIYLYCIASILHGKYKKEKWNVYYTLCVPRNDNKNVL